MGKKKMRLELHEQTSEGEPVDIVANYTDERDKVKIEKIFQEVRDDLKLLQEVSDLRIHQPGTCPKCGLDNIEVLWTDCGVCCLLCLSCKETWTEPHEEI
jgi:transposase-like protein